MQLTSPMLLVVCGIEPDLDIVANEVVHEVKQEKRGICLFAGFQKSTWPCGLELFA